MAIGVEEFVPDRLKVNVKNMPAAFYPGDTAKIMFDAMNFFGTAAATRNYEVAIRVDEKQFRSKDFERYNFSLCASLRSFRARWWICFIETIDLSCFT